jgi:hypothetical protein
MSLMNHSLTAIFLAILYCCVVDPTPCLTILPVIYDRSGYEASLPHFAFAVLLPSSRNVFLPHFISCCIHPRRSFFTLLQSHDPSFCIINPISKSSGQTLRPVLGNSSCEMTSTLQRREHIRKLNTGAKPVRRRQRNTSQFALDCSLGPTAAPPPLPSRCHSFTPLQPTPGNTYRI